MGGEFGQEREWAHEGQLEWELLAAPAHRRRSALVGDLNRAAIAREPALHELDFAADGFEWIEAHDHERSVIAFVRKARGGAAPILVVCNLTPVPRARLSPRRAARRPLERDPQHRRGPYGGSGVGNQGGVDSAAQPSHGRAHSLSLTLPPLGRALPPPRRAHESAPAGRRQRARRAARRGAPARRHRRRRCPPSTAGASRSSASSASRCGRGALLRRRPRSPARHAALAPRRPTSRTARREMRHRSQRRVVRDA